MVRNLVKIVTIVWALGGLAILLLAFNEGLGTGLVVGAPVICIWLVGLLAFGIVLLLTHRGV